MKSEKKVKLGFITGLTGPYSTEAKNQVLGARLAVDEINKRGGILGRRVEILTEDDQMDIGVAEKKAIELLDEKGADFLCGSISAATQIGINNAAKQRKAPFMSISQSNEITTGAQLGPYTFHEALTPQMNVKSIGRWVSNNLSDSWYLMVADYAWGNQCLDIYLDFAEKNKIKVKGITKFPFGSGSFNRYFPKIVKSKAETLILTCWGTDQLAFIKQATKYGLKRKISIVHSISDITVAQKMDSNAAAGMYWGTNFYWGISQHIESAKEFTNNFKRAFRILPSGYAGYGYSGVKELLLAADKAGEYPINPSKITSYLEGRTYDHYKGKQWWRPCDHQSFQDLYVMKFKGPEERKNKNDLAEFVGSVSWDMEVERTCQELDNVKHLWGHIQKS